MTVGRIPLRLRLLQMLLPLLLVLLKTKSKVLLPQRLERFFLELRIMVMILILPVMMVMIVNGVQMKVMIRKILLLTGSQSLPLRLRLLPTLWLGVLLHMVQLLLNV